MKRYIFILFVLILFLNSCNKSKAWDIDWMFQTRDLTVSEIEENFKIRLTDRQVVGLQEGFTYKISNNEFDFIYFLYFQNGRLNRIRADIVPLNMTQQECNLELRRQITRILRIPAYTNDLPELGIEMDIENLLFNAVRLNVYYRNIAFPQTIFGKWDFRYDEKTKEHISNNIIPMINLSGFYGQSDTAVFIENMVELVNNNSIWEINDRHILINGYEFEYDVKEHEIIIFARAFIGSENFELAKFNYQIERNNIIKINWDGEIWKQSFGIFNIIDDTILYLIGNKIE